MTEKCFVVEITPVVADDGSTQTFLFGTAAFATKPTDTPANTSVRPLLKNPGSLRRELFSGARVTGAIRPSYGNIVFANPAPDEDSAGELDAWFDYGLSGSKVVVRYGTIGDDYPSAWTTVYIAYAQSFIADLNEITIRLRDRLQLLEQPVVTDGFAGTGGLEGTGGISKKKQFVSSDPGFFPPILVDPNRQIYFVQSTSDGSFGRLVIGILNTFQVFDNGINITRQTPNYASETEILNSSPNQGFVKFYFGPESAYATLASVKAYQGPVYFRLGSPPAGDVRVLGIGYPTDDDFNAWGSTIGTFTAELFALRAGIQKADIDPLTKNLNVGAVFVDDNSTYNDILSDSCIFQQGWYGFTRLDKFKSGALNDPEDDYYYYGITPGVIASGTQSFPTTSKYEFNTSNIQGLRREPVNGMEAPVWKVSVKAGQTWPSQLANGAIPQIKDYFTRDVWTAFQGVSTEALLQNPGALAVEVEMRGRNIQNQFGARLWLERYFVLYGGRRDFFTFTTPMTEEVLALELHDVVTLKTPRFGLSAGKKFRIVGIEIQCASSKGPTLKFTLWGGEIGQMTGYTGGPGSRPYYPPGQTPSAVNPGLLQAQMGAFIGDFFGSVKESGGSLAGATAALIGDFYGDFIAGINISCDIDFDDVVLLLHFDGANNSTTFTDSSLYARSITKNGDAKISTTQSKFGQSSGYFDGTGDYISAASSSEFNLTGDFTAECWVYFSSLANTPHIFQFSGANVNKRWNLFVTSSKITFYTENGSGTGGTRIQTETLNTNQWYHIAITRIGSTFTLYLNGTSKGTSTTTVWPNENMSVEVGVQVFSPAAGDYLNGYVDEFRITNGSSRYSSNFTPSSIAFYDSLCYGFGLVKLLLHFEGANNSTTFTDSSSFNRTSTAYGNTKISNTQSKFGNTSGSFDGNGDYITFPDSNDFWFANFDFTIEFWFYSNNTTGQQVFCCQQTSSSGTSTSCLIDSDGGNFRALFYSGSSSYSVSETNQFVSGQWYHIAITRSGNTLRYFRNGNLIKTNTELYNASFNNISTTFRIGASYDGTQSLNGYLDEFRIIKGKAMYTANFTPPTAPFPDS